MSEAEWSQHKKLIEFATRPGGFRRMMVPNLPYFMVQFDHKGEKGYGHVIEGSGDAAGDEEGLDEGEKGGGDFPRWGFYLPSLLIRSADLRQSDTSLERSLGIYWTWNPDDGDVLDDWTLVGIKKGWPASRSDSIGSIGLD
jgi:CwfJ-like protein